MGNAMTKELTIKEQLGIIVNKQENMATDISSIYGEFKALNGSLRTTMIELAATTEVAKTAQKMAEKANEAAIQNPRENRRYMDKITIAVITSSAAAMVAIICGVVAIIKS